MPDQTLTRHQGRSIGQYNDLQLIDCVECGFIHVDPLPSESDLAEVYDEKFYSSDKPEYLTKSERESAYWESSVYRYRYDTLEALTPAAEESRRILEVGCSGGFFLRYGKSRGWQVLGVEPSRQAAEYADTVSQVPVIRDYFQNVPVSELGEGFDAVHMQYVLEHLPNPVEMCRKAIEVLKPGGILCVEIPNDFNPLQTLAHRHLEAPEYWVSIPHHLNYFNRESLSGLMTRLGLTVVDEEASFPMELFLLMGDNYVGNDTVGRDCHARRMKLEQALALTPETRELRNQVYRQFAALGLGRTLTLFARKP
jgi:2-polyprenyl-3-methyl-5-hydroxy-6-metoxy-1,4-benzoquinol methylase